MVTRTSTDGSNLQVPYADSWTVGLQRGSVATWPSKSATSARGRATSGRLNYNEINIFDNGFIQEFRAAQANLRANVAARLGNQGFAYRGPGTGTVPLPIMFAHFQGAGDPTNPAAYMSTNFRTNNNFLTPLATYNPNPFTFATNLYRQCRAARQRGERRPRRELLRREPRSDSAART